MATPATAKKQFFFTALAGAMGAYVLASSGNAPEPSDAPIIRDEPGKMESTSFSSFAAYAEPAFRHHVCPA
jgi:hypothetical protein